ncbi:MAG TPA: ATP-binding protein [Dongiaceae bacterium]|nr:ATP-binding protein [Dongiaceae bacterium]
MMNLGVRLRLAALGFAVGLMGALIVLVTLSSQKRAEDVRTRLGQVDLESFQIADRFKDTLRHANESMRRYASANDPAAWTEFLQAADELKSWIDRQATKTSTGRELAILKRMRPVCESFVLRARDLHAQMQAADEAGASLAQYGGFTEQSRRLWDLGQDFARAHFDSRNLVLAHTGQTLKRLRFLVLVLVALLFAFGAALAGVSYRDLIAPLRIKLVESQAEAGRNEKLAALGVLAAGVAHEIRNPLTAIKTALFALQKKLPPESSALGQGQILDREVSRLERIVNGFLQFARPADPNPATIRAGLPLAEVQALLGPELAKAAIQLDTEELAPMQIHADPAQLQQVLINLVQNAADSIGSGGRIVLRARPDHKRIAEKDTPVAVLEVADNGDGIAPEVEKRLFDPFFTTKAGGTGLGLSIAARLVQMNGGVLQYQTQLNRGSTFGLVFPRADA